MTTAGSSPAVDVTLGQSRPARPRKRGPHPNAAASHPLKGQSLSDQDLAHLATSVLLLEEILTGRVIELLAELGAGR